jgi:hypothetical protein
LLAAATILLYLPTSWFGFVNYDDTDYVVDNPHTSSGLTLENITWAFRESYAANWHPFTWISHMIDCQLFGPIPGPAHLINALLHAVNSLLLFIIFFRATGFIWRSWITAALFAFHPLHVESVAWIAERKDVLSTFFFFLALLCYVRFAENGPLHSERCKSHRKWYFLALIFFACGLLSKAMIVTLPFLLLLVDYWPLQRWQLLPAQIPNQTRQPSPVKHQRRSIPKLLLEKVPFFALAAGSCLVTFIAQSSGGAVAPLDSTPLSDRLANAALSYCRYLGKILWPVNLFIPYVPELDQNALLPWVAGGTIVLGVILATTMARRCKYVPVCCFWYLGTLAPVIGIVKVGSQTMADRYSYIPSVGIFVMMTWGCADLLMRFGFPRPFGSSLSVAVLCACFSLCVRQIGYWKNSETLFLHALAADPTNLVALSCLASSYAADPSPSVRNGAKAVLLAQSCVEQTHRTEPLYLDILSTAYAEVGQFQLALQTAEETLRLPATTAQPFFRAQVQKHIELFKSGRAVRAR